MNKFMRQIDFIPSKLAIKLKEKGFNEKCIAKYCNGSLVLNKVIIDGECEYIDYYKEINVYDLLSNNKYTILAPTIYQVLDWLRINKGIHIEVSPVFQTKLFMSTICYTHEGKFVKNFAKKANIYESYEEAILDKMEFIIDKLI